VLGQAGVQESGSFNNVPQHQSKNVRPSLPNALVQVCSNHAHARCAIPSVHLEQERSAEGGLDSRGAAVGSASSAGHCWGQSASRGLQTGTGRVASRCMCGLHCRHAIIGQQAQLRLAPAGVPHYRVSHPSLSASMRWARFTPFLQATTAASTALG